jgi:hypothetical protein
MGFFSLLGVRRSKHPKGGGGGGVFPLPGAKILPLTGAEAAANGTQSDGEKNLDQDPRVASPL